MFIGLNWSTLKCSKLLNTVFNYINPDTVQFTYSAFTVSNHIPLTKNSPGTNSRCMVCILWHVGCWLFFVLFFCKRETHNRQRLLQTKIQLHVPHSFRSTSVTATKFPCHVGDRCALVWHKYVGWMCTWAFVGSSFALSSPLYNCKKSCWSRCLWVCLQW